MARPVVYPYYWRVKTRHPERYKQRCCVLVACAQQDEFMPGGVRRRLQNCDQPQLCQKGKGATKPMDIIEILDEIEKTYPPHQVAPDVTLDELSVIMDQYPGMVGRIKATEQRHLTKLIRERLDEQNEVELKSFCNCKFPEKRGFIESGSHVGDHEHGRHNVSICMNCGKIHVHTYKNGEHYSVTFHIILPEQVAAIQKYIDLLAKEDEMANYGRE